MKVRIRFVVIYKYVLYSKLPSKGIFTQRINKLYKILRKFHELITELNAEHGLKATSIAHV